MDKSKKIRLEFIDWEYECEDRCCYSSGTRLKLNGKELEHPLEDSDNSYLGEDATYAIQAVLKELGYTNVEVVYGKD